MSNKVDFQEVYEFFLAKNYTWTVDGKLINPSPEQISDMVVNLTGVLDSQEDAGTVDSGRILVRDIDGNRELWLYAGDIV